MKKNLTLSGSFGLFLLLSLIQVGSSSCEKEVLIRDTVVLRDTLIKMDTVTLDPETEIIGLWIGSYSVDLLPNEAPRYYSFVLKPDHKIIVEGEPLDDQWHYAFGSWNLLDSILTADFTYSTTVQGFPVRQTISATFDKEAGKLKNGIWVNQGAPAGAGKFNMLKVPD